jgi:hypothetical protein
MTHELSLMAGRAHPVKRLAGTALLLVTSQIAPECRKLVNRRMNLCEKVFSAAVGMTHWRTKA